MNLFRCKRWAWTCKYYVYYNKQDYNVAILHRVQSTWKHSYVLRKTSLLWQCSSWRKYGNINNAHKNTYNFCYWPRTRPFICKDVLSALNPFAHASWRKFGNNAYKRSQNPHTHSVIAKGLDLLIVKISFSSWSNCTCIHWYCKLYQCLQA